MEKLQLVVADDEVLVRQGLCGLLSLEPDLEVVGQAANGAEAVEMVRRLKPSVVLMDVQMPVMNGVEATRQIISECPESKVLILTTFSEDALVVQAIQSGAHGYLLKDSGGKQVAAAIRSIALGYMTLGQDVSRKLVENAQSSRQLDSASKLTPREIEVLNLLAKGATNRDIAQQLSITEKTVRDHVSNILGQLNLRDRTQAALWAKEHGL